MAPSLDKIVQYTPIVLIVLLLLMVLIVEVLGCKWNDFFSGNIDSLFTPGIKVIG
jgi:hypothetical protein